MTKAYRFPLWNQLTDYIVDRIRTNTNIESCISHGAYYVRDRLYEQHSTNIMIYTPLEIFMINYPSDRRWVNVHIICKAVPVDEDHVAYTTTVFNNEDCEYLIVSLEDVLGKIL